ncbi:MAG: iron ABC transporter permease [Chloroflexi bacterium]|nr:iron ABC transporter permease [Chloroflexota bacterium]
MQAPRSNILPALSLATTGQPVRRGIELPRLSPTPLLWLATGAILLLIVFPIGLVIASSFQVAAPGQPAAVGLANWLQAWSDAQVPPALVTTVEIVLIRTALALTLATLLAWLITRTNMPGASWLEFGLWASIFLPTLAAIQAWVFLLEGRVGLLNQWLQRAGFAGFDVYSFGGIIWVHLMAQNVTPLFLLLATAFRNMDADLEDASRMSGTSPLRTMPKVTLPLLKPVFGLLIILALIRGLQSFEIEQVLGEPGKIYVFSTLVVQMLNGEFPRLEEAAALSALVLACLVPLILAYRAAVGRRQYTTVSGKMRPRVIELGGWRWPAFAFVALFVFLKLVVPMAAVLTGSLMTRWGFFGLSQPWTLDHWRAVIADPTFGAAVASTVQVALLAAVCGAAVMFLVASLLQKKSFGGREILSFVAWLPWAIPGVLLSFGFLGMVLRIPPLRVFHGTIFILVVAIVVFEFPLGVQLLRAGLMQLSGDLQEASSASGASWWHTQRQVILPLITPMLLVVMLLTFIAAMNDVASLVLLADVKTRTLALLTLSFLTNTGGKEAAAVINCIIIVMSLGVAGAARAAGLRLAINADAT